MPCAPSRVVYHVVWVAYGALRLCLVSGINRRTTPPLPYKRFVDALGYVWWLRLSFARRFICFASLVARSPTLVIGLCDPWSKSTPSSWLFRAMGPEPRAASPAASVLSAQTVCSSLLPARLFSSPPAVLTFPTLTLTRSPGYGSCGMYDASAGLTGPAHLAYRFATSAVSSSACRPGVVWGFDWSCRGSPSMIGW